MPIHRHIIVLAFAACLPGVSAAQQADPEKARDAQDRPALEAIAARRAKEAAARPRDSRAQYGLALAQSMLAQVALETGDKRLAREAAEAGIPAAREAMSIEPKRAEHHRILGALCAQVIPANVLAGLKYGRCARDSVEEAIRLDPRSAPAYLSRGVGNYYLPKSFGGGLELALRDIDKAIELNPSFAEAHLWRGIVLRKAGRAAEARKAIEKCLQLNPNRVWARLQLEKTPAQ